MAATFEVGFVHFFTQFTIISVGEERNQARFAEGKNPNTLFFAVQGLGVGCGLDRCGQTFQIIWVVDYQRKGIVVSQQVVAELYAEG